MSDNRLKNLLEYTRASGRVCPVPHKWQVLWEMLPDKVQQGFVWTPPTPLIVGAWWHTSDAEKRDRFELHIRYAAEKGELESIEPFLKNLAPEQWVCEGDV